jgi:hypothetical protein
MRCQCLLEFRTHYCCSFLPISPFRIERPSSSWICCSIAPGPNESVQPHKGWVGLNGISQNEVNSRGKRCELAPISCPGFCGCFPRQQLSLVPLSKNRLEILEGEVYLYRTSPGDRHLQRQILQPGWKKNRSKTGTPAPPGLLRIKHGQLEKKVLR